MSLHNNVECSSECDQRNCDDASLRRDIRGFIERYVELPGDATAIAVEYVLLTWIYDVFAELAYLGFRTADVGRGKSRALETVGTLCYRPLIVGGGSSAAATLRMLDMFGGTLLADEFDRSANSELGAELNRILNQGFQRQRPLVKCDGEDNAPRPFRCYGPKLFALRKQLGDDATESRTIFIHMQQKTRLGIPINLPHLVFHTEALALRNRLLGWRFANLGRIKIDPTLAAPELEDRANQIGLPLLAVAGSDAIRTQIVTALKEQQGEIAADRADSLAGAVFEAVLAIGNIGDEVRPGSVAQEVNRRNAAAEGVDGEKPYRPVSSHKVGRIMKSELELKRVGKDSGGAKYVLEADRAGQLACRFGVPLPETSLTSQRHSPAETSLQNPLFEGARGDPDASDVCDVSQGGPGAGVEMSFTDDSVLADPFG